MAFHMRVVIENFGDTGGHINRYVEECRATSKKRQSFSSVIGNFFALFFSLTEKRYIYYISQVKAKSKIA
jgi:hypothetical protein